MNKVHMSADSKKEDNRNKVKYILWGTGNCANLIWEEIKDEVFLVIDNNSELWGTSWNGYVIHEPACLASENFVYDRIIIASVEWKSIRKQLIRHYHIENKKIDNTYFKKRQAFLDFNKKLHVDNNKQLHIRYIEENPIDVFNNSFSDKYEEYSDVEVYYDIDKGLYYVIHANKRMYFSKKYASKERCARYYKGLLMEQDESSPHRYRTKDFDVKHGDVVLDAGVAEGNFALEVIDFVSKIYLVEADEDWIEALQYTFEPYMNKVQMVKGFLGDGKNGTIMIDEIIGNNQLDFIKMDIEGFEKEALEGAQETLQKNSPSVVICTYHNVEDYDFVEQKLKLLDYNIESPEGYMIFLNIDNYKKIDIPVLVKGIIRGYKNGN